MGRGTDSRAGRRAWLAGRVAVLLAVAVAGVLAIVHYSSWGAALAQTLHDPAAAVTQHARAVTIHRNSPSASSHAASTASAHQAGQPHQSAAPPASPPASSSSTGHATAPSPPQANPSTSPTASPSPSPSSSGTGAPTQFGTLPPGAKLPTGTQCARWVLATPLPENKSANRTYNHTTGQYVGAVFFPAGDSPLAEQLLAPRINGDFTGTTQEILRWAACKWGISQKIVFAQAAVESWWNQDTLGDWGRNPRACPAGHRLGADGRPGKCPQSYGILQNRYPLEKAAWPGIADSTAMNVDAGYAIWRSCYDGYEVWLNNEPRGQQYQAGDVWGCVGSWFAGRWYTTPAQNYIARVKAYLSERIWEQPYFKQTS